MTGSPASDFLRTFAGQTCSLCFISAFLLYLYSYRAAVCSDSSDSRPLTLCLSMIPVLDSESYRVGKSGPYGPLPSTADLTLSLNFSCPKLARRQE